MSESIQDYLVNDSYRPVTENKPLQKWDNYCIYSIVCIDKAYSKHTIEYARDVGGAIGAYDRPIVTDTQTTVKGSNLLAVQTFSTVPIPINFFDYVNQYHEQ
jgi:hypothetical protein